MAWTAPATWSTSEVVVASKMNTHIRDNFNYLKGNAGEIAFASSLSFPTAGTSKGRLVSAVTDWAGLSLNAGYSGGWNLDDTSKPGWFFKLDSRGAGNDDFAVFRVPPGANPHSDEARLMTLGSTGNLGIGVQTAAGKLHVGAAGAVSGAGMVIGSVAAVTSLQTVFAAGTVARAAWFFAFDRNNTGGALFAYNAAIPISTSTSYINTDTITIAITAGGAVTAQRTSGTNGTHDIVLFLFLM